MATRSVGGPRGILHRVPEGASSHSRQTPPDDLAPFVEHFWSVRWDLRGRAPVLQETLPHPSVHLVIEKAEARVVGVVRGRFSRLLEGEGRVFGIKFRPGGFYPFVGWPVSRITNRVLDPAVVFGDSAHTLAAAVYGQEDEAMLREVATAFLRARRPERDPTAERVGRAVSQIVDDRGINTVEDLAKALALRPRTLQRLFSRYVGIGPKWVIQRYRLHEAIESIQGGHVLDWAGLALDLGYFDQAHFVRDFKALVGRPPGDYARSLATAPREVTRPVRR